MFNEHMQEFVQRPEFMVIDGCLENGWCGTAGLCDSAISQAVVITQVVSGYLRDENNPITGLILDQVN